ncbi:MAG: preprotein translocase subunit SecA [Candidatus Komeilibacteria bacterium]|nr:preprotein translocase subunit SecA [Candidatus Komeilibacteria bacterium]
MSFIYKIFGDANKRYLKGLEPLVLATNSLEEGLLKLSNNELKAKTQELKTELASGKILDDILPLAFALVREAAKRTLNQRHYDVQLLGGIVLHQGQIAEMKTGEGKTMVATLPAYLNALSGKGVHVITVNDYLAKRDTVWMGQIYDLLGLSVACVQHEKAFLYDASYQAPELTEAERDRGVVVNENYLKPVPRREAYAADITYGTNNEYGFDYLRDNMVQSLGQMVQRDLNFAIIDEVDSILIDEARTPLIISAPAEESTDQYFQFARLVKNLKENDDYNIDEKMRAASLTEKGIEKIEKALGVKNIYESHGIGMVHHLEAALKAETLFKRDRDYVVKDDEVIIVDEFTGRLMFGRRYSEGLHQAIEAKENVKVQRESITMATVTFQNYFRMYKKLSGMTGTAATESEEFAKIYNLDVTVVPTNKPMVRHDLNDLIYKSEMGKFKAVVAEVKKRHSTGQPVLIGTISIEKNEVLSELLSREGIKHELLNAKNHEREAQIIAQAGRWGAVTLATNMAGRGVDIILGGYLASADEARQVREVGGLHILGTERHESRRIDNQLRGRSGRQGDNGSSQFFVSLDDDLMRIFGSERLKSIMTTLRVPEDMPIENKLISKSLESAQHKVEGNNFDIRKHLVEYDDVINKHREVIYKKRRAILNQEISGKNVILEYLEQEITQVVNFHFSQETTDNSNNKEIIETVNSIFILTEEEKEKIATYQTAAELIEYLVSLAKEKYQAMEEGQAETLRNIESRLLLNAIDTLWVEHLEAIDHLRTGIGLRGYGQRDPLIEYKKDSYQLFKTLLATIQSEVVYTIFKVGQASVLAASGMSNNNLTFSGAAKTALDKQSGIAKLAGENQKNRTAQVISVKPKDETGHKIGRNDPCYCGSGKKFKKCHGK